MINNIQDVAAIVIIGIPILAWVIRIERKLTKLCSTINHIKYTTDKEAGVDT